MFISSASGLDKMCLAQRRIRVGQEYNPCALLRGIESISVSISVGVTE